LNPPLNRAVQHPIMGRKKRSLVGRRGWGLHLHFHSSRFRRRSGRPAGGL
jgi:hypothetical protein